MTSPNRPRPSLFGGWTQVRLPDGRTEWRQVPQRQAPGWPLGTTAMGQGPYASGYRLPDPRDAFRPAIQDPMWRTKKSLLRPSAEDFGRLTESPVERQPPAPVSATRPLQVGAPRSVKGDPKSSLVAALVKSGHFDQDEIGQIMAQVEDESAFRSRPEDMRYSSASRLRSVFGKRITPAQAEQLVAAGPEAIASHVYGGRMGNAPDEGFKYRGRGYNQLTGKDNYRAIGQAIGVDLAGNPDLANDPYIAGLIVAEFYRKRKAEGLDLRTSRGATMATNPRNLDKEIRERSILAAKYDRKTIEELARRGSR